jgi:acyl-CoA synthetase (AMP-forming)/AMP-acid ligase II
VRSYQWRFGLSGYGPGDRVGCNVFFIWEMLRPLLRGATTVVIPDDVIYDPGTLTRFLEEFGISETLMTPSLLEAMLDASGPDLSERLSALRVLWLNGEVVTKTLARRVLSLLPETRVLNVYSCSETHEVAAGELRELAESPRSTYCPVGRPMDPSRLYILDREMREVPEGEAGELFVGGDCLARGYLGLPEKTRRASHLIPSPPQKTPGCTAPVTRRASCPTATSRYWAARTSWSRSGATASSWGRWRPPSGRASPSGPASSSPMGRRARTSA